MDPIDIFQLTEWWERPKRRTAKTPHAPRRERSNTCIILVLFNNNNNNNNNRNTVQNNYAYHSWYQSILYIIHDETLYQIYARRILYLWYSGELRHAIHTHCAMPMWCKVFDDAHQVMDNTYWLMICFIYGADSTCTASDELWFMIPYTRYHVIN